MGRRKLLNLGHAAFAAQEFIYSVEIYVRRLH